MRTTRVLDLCREAEQSVADSSEQGHAIRKLSAAIREMTEGEPEVMNYRQLLDGFLDEWGKLVRKGTVSSLSGIEICILNSFADWLQQQKLPPKST